MAGNVHDRFSRQSDLVPQERLNHLAVTIIGIGAVGRQLALQLAAMGVRKLTLIDFDVVDQSNLCTQAYFEEDLGREKVSATAAAIALIDRSIEVQSVCDRFHPSMELSPVVFCAVDSIAVRAAIWRSVRSRCDFWADGRILGEVTRVLAAADPEARQHFDGTLFPQQEAVQGRCTARGTIFTASIAAGMMVHQFTRWLRGHAIDRDSILSLPDGELVLQ